ncbi:MAG: HTH-type transcriptional regulator IscR [Fimbriimonadaceae bacterium]|nr:HTH-type transcriptional regulator IscR [Fimbriimonadaceae bacterium]
MKLSAQEEYGLRCVLAIAGSPNGMTIPEISDREGLSQPNTAKLLAILRKSGLVLANRGQSGGYMLGRPAAEIKVGEVLEVLGGRLLDDDFCDRHTGRTTACSHLTGCAIHGLWSRLQFAIDKVVYAVSLQDLLAEAPAVDKSANVNFSFGSRPQK